MDAKRFQAARAELSDFVVWQAHEVTKLTGKTYKVVADAPSTLAQMQAAWALNTPFPVWSGASGNTVYLDPWRNQAFRFWHDYIHVLHSLDTSFDDEVLAAHYHQAVADDKLSYDALRLLWIDTYHQSVFCRHTGAFPTDQLTFAKDRF